LGFAASREFTREATPDNEMTDAKPPRTYAEWLPLLDRFREGDDSALDAIRQGSIEWTSVVAERWTSQIAATLTTRLQAVSRQLQLGLNRARDPFSVSRAMIDARRSLLPLRALATLPCAPEDVRQHLNAEVERFIRQTQETLEQSARQSRVDNGLVLKTIRDNPLTASVEADLSRIGSAPQPSPVSRGRRVII
jgi:hypothetical protein